MAEAIRYGVIGTGMMGCEHIRNIMEIDDARLAAHRSIDEQRPVSFEELGFA